MEENDSPVKEIKQKDELRVKVTVLGKDYLLTKKQEFFCRYWVANGHNGTKAAIDAGYSKKTAKEMAVENLSKPHLIKFIEQLEKPVLEKLDVDENWVLSKLKSFADASYLDFFDVIATTQKKITTVELRLKDLNSIPKEKLLCLETIKDKGEGDWEIKLVGKLPVIMNIGKHLGMFKEQIEGTMAHTLKASVFIIPQFEQEEKEANK